MDVLSRADNALPLCWRGQVPSTADLCELISNLQEGNCTDEGGTYAGIYLVQPDPSLRLKGLVANSGEGSAGVAGPLASVSHATDSKVTAICTAIRAAVEALSSSSTGSTATTALNEYLDVIVTSFARSSPRRLEEALLRIRDAKEAAICFGCADGGSAGNEASDDDDRGGDQAVSTSSTEHMTSSAGAAERALRRLLLTVDASELYRAALGMDELPLAYMVVVTAQGLDPAEYLDQLQRFGAIQDTNVRRYHINLFLGRQVDHGMA